MRDIDRFGSDEFLASDHPPIWHRLSWTVPVFFAVLLAVFVAWLMTAEAQIQVEIEPVSTATPASRLAPFQEKLESLIETVAEAPDTINDPSDLIPSWPQNRAFTVLFLGIDRRGDDPSGRTDSMIWLHVDPITAAATAVSIPRDICVAACETEPVRINAVKDLHGVAGLKGEVANLISQPVDYHVTMEFAGFVELVDFFGGVEVDIEAPIRDDIYPSLDDTRYESFYLDRGLHRLDGDLALKFVRTRYQDGDFGRVQRQQQFLRAVHDQLISPALLVQAPALASQLAATFETDIPIASLPSLVKLALRVPAESIVSGVIDYSDAMAVPVTSENGAQVLLPNRQVIRSYVSELLDNAPTGDSDIEISSDSAAGRQHLEP